jgi:hypothetical protein
VAIREFFNFVGGTLYPNLCFKSEDINVLIETPDQVFAEYTVHTKAARTGRILHHLFAGRLVARKGKITLVRESRHAPHRRLAWQHGGVRQGSDRDLFFAVREMKIE